MAIAARPSLPRDGNGQVIQLAPSGVALQQTVNSTLSSAQTITFNASSVFLRCYATSQDVYLKWGTTAVTSSNFDDIIPAGQIVDFFIPLQSTGVRYTACTLIERSASASIVAIER